MEACFSQNHIYRLAKDGFTIMTTDIYKTMQGMKTHGFSGKKKCPGQTISKELYTDSI